jgi:predicted RNA-binding Zn-ribbon protein involved in translation (DUF1610 family)
MPKMICVKCEVELRPEENGVKVKELFHRNTAVYRVWDADLWQCPKCGLQVVVGFGERPITEHYQDDFQKILGFVEEHEHVILDKEYFDDESRTDKH